MASTTAISGNSNTATTTSGITNKNAGDTSGLQDRFLTLLVAQMKNQDPLNPLDNAQVTTQLAQINTVNGIQTLNNTMSMLASNFNNLQLVQGASMIGHNVLVPSSNLNLSQGNAVGGFSLDQPVDKVIVEIRDLNGTLVQSVDLGAQTEGIHGFAWDGKDNQGTSVTDGRYTLKINAVRDGEKISATALSLGQVNSLTPGANGMQISVEGLGQFPITDIKQMI